MTDYSKRTRQLLNEKSNCARAIAEAFSDITKEYSGVTADNAALFEQDTGHELCGAIHGIGIVVGKIYSSGRAKTIMIKLIKKFRKRFGALTCRELAPDGEEFQVPEVDRMPFCTEYVGYAAEILARQLEEDGII